MSAHYCPHPSPVHKNAWKRENPASSENLSQPANASGSPNDSSPIGLTASSIATQNSWSSKIPPANMPAAAWPVQGVSGPVSLAEAQAAAAALILTVKTRDSYTTQQAQDTLAAALGLRRINFGD